MSSQIERAEILARLHVKGNPLVLFNIWDAGSAQAIQEIGARVIATGSWSVAAAHGYSDGEKLPFDLALANLRRIVASVDLPVTIDLEGGYGHSPGEVQETVSQVIEAGAVGINFEDQMIGGDELYPVDEQCMRISAIREAAERVSVPLFINARTDIFLNVPASDHSDVHVEEALSRAAAYVSAGASGFFAPGLRAAQLISRLCEQTQLPVNIMVLPGIPSSSELAALGVSRISYGPGPYRQMIEGLKEAGRKALSMT